MSQFIIEPEKILEMMARVTSLTERGLVSWEAHSKYSFETVIGESGFAIRSRDEDDFHPYDLVIEHAGARLSHVQTVLDSDGAILRTPMNDQVSQLYLAAKRAATGVDTLVKNIFEDLESVEPRPPADDDVPF